MIAPTKNPPAPNVVMAIEKNSSVRLLGLGLEKAVAAAAMNARQPSKFANTIRQERSLKFQLQWLWQVSANAKYPEAKNRSEPTRSGSHT